LRDIFKKMRDIKNYNNVFNSKNAFTFLNYKKKNYNINLLLSKEFFLQIIIFFFQKKIKYFARVFFEEFDAK